MTVAMFVFSALFVAIYASSLFHLSLLTIHIYCKCTNKIYNIRLVYLTNAVYMNYKNILNKQSRTPHGGHAHVCQL